jgi:hypothetical protein
LRDIAAERPRTLEGLRIGLPAENRFDVGLDEPVLPGPGGPEPPLLPKFAMALATAPPRRVPRARRGPRIFPPPFDCADPERVIVLFPEPSTTSSDVGDGLREVTEAFEGVVRPVSLLFPMPVRLRGDGGIIFVTGGAGFD